MRQFFIWNWTEREEIKRKWGNVESKSLSISSFSLHFLFFFSLSLSPFSRSQACQAATSCATLQAVASCYMLSPALTAVFSTCQLWLLLYVCASFYSCYKLSPALTALASFDSSHKLSLALISVINCCQLWQLFHAVGSYTSTSLQHQHCLNIWFHHYESIHCRQLCQMLQAVAS